MAGPAIRFIQMILLHVMIGADRGGCERNAEMVVRYLAGVRHRVLFLARGGPMEADFRDAGATVDLIPHDQVRTNADLIARLRAYAAEHRPAAVMIWHGVWLPQLLHAFGELGVPLGVHGGNPFHTLPWWADWKLLLLGLRYPLRRPPTYVCCSQYVADSLDTSRYRRRFPRAVVPNGVQVPVGDRYRFRPLDPAGPFTVGMLARLDRIKDQPTLLRAFARLLRRCPLARLELAGGGSEEAGLRALAEALGVESAVRFLGEVTDIYGVMAGWDLFAYATTEREGFGNTLAEALMFGLPAAVTDVGPMREVCGPDETVVLAPGRDPETLADALYQLVADADLRRRVADAGRRRAEGQFHPAVFARRYGDILLAPGRGPAEKNPTRDAEPGALSPEPRA
jgi:glycosyltransferase involved in cell wall biosynthesis